MLLLAKEEKMLRGVIDRLIELVRCYGMEMNVQKYSDENVKTIILSTDYDRAKTTEECGIFQLFG